ncbi:MAG: serine/threonine protein kinase [Myxococcaceae bacterium]|nr:serine/threonine protein kinase [Myxococcaceae bacterium]
MNAAPVDSLPARLLQDYMRQDVAPREASIARFMCGMSALSVVAALSLAGIIGWGLSLSLGGLTAALCIYYALTLRALRQGWFHPVLQWVNTAVMVSIPAVVFAIDWRFHGPEYALTAPPLVVWGALIVVSALRAGRALAYAGAALAALEYLALYFLLALPQLPPDTLSNFTPPLILVRAAFLFSYGPLTATLARHLTRKAEEALRAVREKDVMGKYFLHERLGVGGMAEVFRATYSPEGGFEKQVALKRVLPAYAGHADFLTMFRREAELGSLLVHPNIVQVLDLGRHRETLFLVMEYVEGLSLAALLERTPGGRLPPSAVAYLGAELAGALAYVHGRTSADGTPLELVHRDLNPPNVLLSRIGEVKLSDFGIARAAGQVRLTEARAVRGKAGYVAPEQARGDALDGRADLFALGLTLYEALTGRPAFQGSTDAELLRASVEVKLVPPSHLRSGISAALEAVVMGLLHPELRYRTPTGEVVQRALLSLTGPEAPYPHGRLALAEAVRQAARPVAPIPLTPTMALPQQVG